MLSDQVMAMSGMNMSPEYKRAQQERYKDQMDNDQEVQQQYEQQQPHQHSPDQPQPQKPNAYAHPGQVPPAQQPMGQMNGGMMQPTMLDIQVMDAVEMQTHAHEVQRNGKYSMPNAWMNSVLIYCDACRKCFINMMCIQKEVTSIVKCRLSTIQWVMLFLLFPILMCWIPLLSKGNYSYHHHCPDCDKNLRQVRPYDHYPKYRLC